MSDLKERYIYAVVKNLPRASRQDIKMELATLIDDMLEARCGENEPTEKDLRVVLTELGTPAELYEKYNPDAGKILIGADYYVQYKRWTTIVVCAVVCSMVFSQLLSAILGEMQWLPALTEMIAKSFAAVLSGVGAVTLVFILLQKKGIKVGNPCDTIENLPSAPKQKEKIPVGDCIAGIVLSVGAAVLFLAFPEYICIGLDEYGCKSVFQADLLREAWVWIVLFGAMGAARSVLQLVMRKRSVRLLICTAVCDVLGIAGLMIAFLRPEIMNPVFLQIARVVLETHAPFVQQMILHFNVTLPVVIAAAILIDLMVETVRTLRAV